MEKKTTTIIAAVVVVAIVVVAAVLIGFGGNGGNDSSGDSDIASQLQIRGNANDDYTIDEKDMEILDDVISGDKSIDDYPLADVNNDGNVDETDKQLLQDLIDRKDGTTVYVLCLDVNGKPTTVSCTYPLRNVVPYGTNMQLPTLYANGGQYVAGYFVSSYETAESSISDSAVDLGGTQRQISDAAWKNFTTLDANTEGGLGALLVDYSGIAQITDVRAADLEAADIPMIIYSSADATSEITTVLTLGFLFGGDCEEIGVEYAQKSWDVINLIEEKVGSLSNDEKCSYICCTMYIYICENDSTFNSSASTAGGLPYYIVNSDFSETYAGDGSTKMQSVEALSNYTDVGAILNNRSMDWGLDEAGIEELVIDTWDHDNKGVSSTMYFKGFEDRLVYINNLLPGAVKVAYMAHAMYGDDFSREWADGVLQDFIDMGTAPLEGQTLDTVLAYIDYDLYREVTA